MACYAISLVGSYKMWIWWDGTQLWEEGNATSHGLAGGKKVPGAQQLNPGIKT